MTTEPGPDAGVPLDWAMARSVAGRLVRPGPTAPRGDLVTLVEELREHARIAITHVAEITGLPAADPVVRIIDRTSWARANVDIVEAMTGGRLTSRGEVGARLGAAELGSAVAALSGKVLGQFDPFGPRAAAQGGQLLVVAPNVLQIERELAVAPSSFRLWVCLHEQTHALQFAAAPWLAGHLIARMQGLLDSLSGEDETGSLLDLLSAVPRVLREEDDGESTTPALLDETLDEEQRAVFDEITAVMSLLEGHADVVMDEVGPAVIPDIAVIRERFEQRRSGRGRLDRAMRRLLGLDAKIAQYRSGASFVRSVVEDAGMSGLNRVWHSPKSLPTAVEIAEPDRWIARTGG